MASRSLHLVPYCRAARSYSRRVYPRHLFSDALSRPRSLSQRSTSHDCPLTGILCRLAATTLLHLDTYPDALHSDFLYQVCLLRLSLGGWLWCPSLHRTFDSIGLEPIFVQSLYIAWSLMGFLDGGRSWPWCWPSRTITIYLDGECHTFVTTVLATVDDYLSWCTQFTGFVIMRQISGMLDSSLPQPARQLFTSQGLPYSNPTYNYWLQVINLFVLGSLLPSPKIISVRCRIYPILFTCGNALSLG